MKSEEVNKTGNSLLTLKNFVFIQQNAVIFFHQQLYTRQLSFLILTLFLLILISHQFLLSFALQLLLLVHHHKQVQYTSERVKLPVNQQSSRYSVIKKDEIKE
jgi:hypothetical protein